MTRELAYSIILLIITLIAFSDCYLPKKVIRSPILVEAHNLDEATMPKQQRSKTACIIGLSIFSILSGLIVYWGFFAN